MGFYPQIPKQRHHIIVVWSWSNHSFDSISDQEWLVFVFKQNSAIIKFTELRNLLDQGDLLMKLASKPHRISVWHA